MNIFQRKAKHKRGFAMVEAVIAIAIIGIITVAAVTITGNSNKVYDDALDRMRARALADNSLTSFQYASDRDDYERALGLTNCKFIPTGDETEENYEYNAMYYRIKQVMADKKSRTLSVMDVNDKTIYTFTCKSDNEYQRARDFLDNDKTYHQKIQIGEPVETFKFSFKVNNVTYTGEIKIDGSTIRITDGYSQKNKNPSELFYRDGKFYGKYYWAYEYQFVANSGFKSTGSHISTTTTSKTSQSEYDKKRKYPANTDLTAEAVKARELLKSKGCVFETDGDKVKSKVTVEANYSQKYITVNTRAEGSVKTSYYSTTSFNSALENLQAKYSLSETDSKYDYVGITINEAKRQITQKKTQYRSTKTITQYLYWYEPSWIESRFGATADFKWSDSANSISEEKWDDALDYIDRNFNHNLISESYEGFVLEDAAEVYKFTAANNMLAKITASFDGNGVIKLVNADQTPITIAQREFDSRDDFVTELKKLNGGIYGELPENVYKYSKTITNTATVTYDSNENISGITGTLDGKAIQHNKYKTYASELQDYISQYALEIDESKTETSTTRQLTIDESQKTITRKQGTTTYYYKASSSMWGVTYSWSKKSSKIDYKYWSDAKQSALGEYPDIIKVNKRVYTSKSTLLLSASYSDNKITYSDNTPEKSFSDYASFMEEQLKLYNSYTFVQEGTFSYDFYRYFKNIVIDYETDMAQFYDAFGDVIFSFSLENGMMDTYEAADALAESKTGKENNFALQTQTYLYKKGSDEFIYTVDYFNNRVIKKDETSTYYWAKIPAQSRWEKDTIGWTKTVSTCDIDEFFETNEEYSAPVDCTYAYARQPLSYLRILATMENNGGDNEYFFSFAAGDNVFVRWQFTSYENYKAAINYYNSSFDVSYGDTTVTYIYTFGDYEINIQVCFAGSLSSTTPTFNAEVTKGEKTIYELEYTKGW